VPGTGAGTAQRAGTSKPSMDDDERQAMRDEGRPCAVGVVPNGLLPAVRLSARARATPWAASSRAVDIRNAAVPRTRIVPEL
jgi:hypothetical protein